MTSINRARIIDFRKLNQALKKAKPIFIGLNLENFVINRQLIRFNSALFY